MVCRAEQAIRSFAIPAAGRRFAIPGPGGLLVRAWGGEYRVVFEDPEGGPVRVLERPHDPAPVDRAAWEEGMEGYREFREEHGAGGCDPSDPRPPEHRPAIRELFVDAEGHLWLEVEDAEGRRFDVYEPDGRLVAEVPGAPERLERVPPVVRGDRLALVVADDLGVERVKLYALRVESAEGAP